MALLIAPRALVEQFSRAAGVHGGLNQLALVLVVYAVLGRAVRVLMDRSGMVVVNLEVQCTCSLMLVAALAVLDMQDLKRRVGASWPQGAVEESSVQEVHNAGDSSDHQNSDDEETEVIEDDGQINDQLESPRHRQRENRVGITQRRSGQAAASSTSQNNAGKDKSLLKRFTSTNPLLPSANLEPWWEHRQESYTGEQEAAIQEMLNSHFGENAPEEKRRALERVIVNGDARSAAIRALVARQFNVQDARKLVDDMLQWRAENKIDEILKYPLPPETLGKIRSCLFDGFTGVCNQGCPVYLLFAGRMDLAECKRLAGIEDTLKYHVQVMEYNMNVYYPLISQMTGKTTSRVTLLLDLKGFGGHNVKPSFWEMINALAAIDNFFYYEWLNKVIIVNAGLFFKFFWKTAAPLLQPETKRKFHVIDIKGLSEHIPLHQLPERFGGHVANEGSYCDKDHPWTNHYHKFDKYVREQAVHYQTEGMPPPTVATTISK